MGVEVNGRVLWPKLRWGEESIWGIDGQVKGEKKKFGQVKIV